MPIAAPRRAAVWTLAGALPCLLVLLLCLLVLLPCLLVLLRGRLRAVAVEGDSMLPTLRPGDWLLVRVTGRVAAGDIVVARHPVQPDLRVVKRAAYRADTGWWLESDNQRAPGRRDSWDFGAVPDHLLVGRVVARYWPPSRAGRRIDTSGALGWQAAVAPARSAQRSEQ